MNFQNTTIVFNNNIETNFQKSIFKKMNIILFSGENGTGKTSIVSFIVKIFRYLERFRERLKSDYMISYEIIEKNQIREIVIRKNNNNIFINIDGSGYYIMEYNIKKKEYQKNEEMADEKQKKYSEIKNYLPSIVGVYGFDTAYDHIYYASNYIGDRLVTYTPIESNYGSSSRGSYISKGIVFVYYNYLKNKKLRNIFNNLGIMLDDEVDVFVNINSQDENVRNNKDKLIEYNVYSYLKESTQSNQKFMITKYLKNRKGYRNLCDLIDMTNIYINDFFIKKNNEIVSISKMSTGEKKMLFSLFSLATNINENGLYIWEEPETHLNVNWAKNLIPILVELFNEFNIQLLLTSHNTYMIKNLFQNQIFRTKKNKVEQVNFNTFLANDTEINNRLLSNDCASFFEDMFIDYLKNCDINNKKELINVLGESYLKFLLVKTME